MHTKTNLLRDALSQRRRRSTGFTLIELMITVGIVAILTAIAYPSYRNYVIRGQFADATNGLAAMRANMERYFQDNRTYMAVGIFTPPCVPVLPVTTITSGKFTITCTTSNTPPGFVLSAQGTVAGSALSGFVFTVDQDGNQATVVTSPPAPSAFLSCTTAWITKTGGC